MLLYLPEGAHNEMQTKVIFDDGTHRNLLLEDFSPRDSIAVQANQNLIVHGADGMILDPGGRQLSGQLIPAVEDVLGPGELKYVFASHQDPDCVGALKTWLTATSARILISALWTRFIPNLGLEGPHNDRVVGIADEGTVVELGGQELIVIPAHFLHSEGNLQVYDPVSKILYTGDLGASFGHPHLEATDFAAHVPFMLSFHKRYMGSNRALRTWARTVRQLDVQFVVPQHGAYFRGPLVQQFIAWCEGFACGVDLLPESYPIPTRGSRMPH